MKSNDQLNENNGLKFLLEAMIGKETDHDVYTYGEPVPNPFN